MLSLYMGIVRPHLEYAVNVWCPNKKSYVIKRLEGRFTKCIPELNKLPYEMRLKNLIILQNRNIHGDLLEVYRS